MVWVSAALFAVSLVLWIDRPRLVRRHRVATAAGAFLLGWVLLGDVFRPLRIWPVTLVVLVVLGRAVIGAYRQERRRGRS